jgi:hypothetical protein
VGDLNITFVFDAVAGALLKEVVAFLRHLPHTHFSSAMAPPTSWLRGFASDFSNLKEPTNVVILDKTLSETDVDALSTEWMCCVKLPHVTDLPDRLFESCDELLSVDAPLATRIGDYTFCQCRRLCWVDAPLVTHIGDFAFYQCEELKVGPLTCVVAIGHSAFIECDALTTMQLPVLTRLGPSAFRSCLRLHHVQLAVLESAPIKSFGNCHSLTRVEAPRLTRVGVKAFLGCGRLAAIPNGAALVNIGKDAFASCGRLVIVDVPLARLGSDAFHLCVNIREMHLCAGMVALVHGMHGCNPNFISCPDPALATFSHAMTAVERSFWTIRTHSACTAEAADRVKTLLLVYRRRDAPPELAILVLTMLHRY